MIIYRTSFFWIYRKAARQTWTHQIRLEQSKPYCTKETCQRCSFILESSYLRMRSDQSETIAERFLRLFQKASIINLFFLAAVSLVIQIYLTLYLKCILDLDTEFLGCSEFIRGIRNILSDSHRHTHTQLTHQGLYQKLYKFIHRFIASCTKGAISDHKSHFVISTSSVISSYFHDWRRRVCDILWTSL